MASPLQPIERSIYRLRFSDEELRQARAFWVPICRYLERYLSTTGATLDLGAGYCHFINTVPSGRKFALDVNPEDLERCHDDVQCVIASGDKLTMFEDGSLDTVFASNVYEHFHSKDDAAECSAKSIVLCGSAAASWFSSPLRLLEFEVLRLLRSPAGVHTSRNGRYGATMFTGLDAGRNSNAHARRVLRQTLVSGDAGSQPPARPSLAAVIALVEFVEVTSDSQDGLMVTVVARSSLPS